jgi:hypothetical protein
MLNNIWLTKYQIDYQQVNDEKGNPKKVCWIVYLASDPTQKPLSEAPTINEAKKEALRLYKLNNVEYA